MNPQNLGIAALLLVSLLAGVAYVTLGLRAGDHLKDRASSDGIGWLFWWSFSPDLYDDDGKKFCRSAQVLAFFIIGLHGVWYWLLLRGN